MTNKQTHAPPEEKPSVELLLRRFKLMDEFVADVRKKNIEAGLDPKLMGYYIHWRGDETMQRKKYDYWLSKVTNKKTGKFNQVADLKARELIPEDEISEHLNRSITIVAI
jgi:ribonucleotide reductase beta subunit family protein with ferritin-like domain